MPNCTPYYTLHELVDLFFLKKFFIIHFVYSTKRQLNIFLYFSSRRIIRGFHHLILTYGIHTYYTVSRKKHKTFESTSFKNFFIVRLNFYQIFSPFFWQSSASFVAKFEVVGVVWSLSGHKPLPRFCNHFNHNPKGKWTENQPNQQTHFFLPSKQQ